MEIVVLSSMGLVTIKPCGASRADKGKNMSKTTNLDLINNALTIVTTIKEMSRLQQSAMITGATAAVLIENAHKSLAVELVLIAEIVTFADQLPDAQALPLLESRFHESEDYL